MATSGKRTLVDDLSSRKKVPRLKANLCHETPCSETGKSSNGIPADPEMSLPKNEASGSSGKRKERKWDPNTEDSDALQTNNEVAKRKKTRWSSDDAQLKRLGPLQLPDFQGVDETEPDLELQKLNRKLMEINKKLMEPDANDAGFFRTKLIKKKQQIITKLVEKTFDVKALPDNKPATHYKKLYVPVKQYPDYNFIGLLIGPRGNTLKRMETESGAKILIRGKGSVKEDKLEKNSKISDPSENEDLHVRVEATNQESLDAAVEMVEKLLVPVDDGANDLKRKQLLELAVLNGKVNTRTCDICGDVSHSTQLCPLIASAPETGQRVGPQSGFGAGIFSSSAAVPIPTMICPQIGTSTSTSQAKVTDEANLYVGHLPHTIDEVSLKQLFDPFGTIIAVKVVRDLATGVSKGHGFVKYCDPASAAIAIEKLHGFKIGEKFLTVRMAGHSPVTGAAASPIRTHTTAIPQIMPDTSKAKVEDEANLFVGYLPHLIDEVRLKQLFDPFGTISAVKVARDPVSNACKGYGFVRYYDPANAATAIEKMHGFKIGNKTLAVRIAGCAPSTGGGPPFPSPSHGGSLANPQVTSTAIACPALPQYSEYFAPAAPLFYPSVPSDIHSQIGTTAGSSITKGTDEANLFVGYLPHTIDEASLKQLFDPFGTVTAVKVARDPLTDACKGHGFVKYSDPASAAIAIEKMHGFRMGKKTLAVRVAGRPPTTPGSSSSAAPTNTDSPANPAATSTATVWSAFPQYNGYFTPITASFHPSVPGCTPSPAFVPPPSLATQPSVLGRSASEQPPSLAAYDPALLGCSILTTPAQPVSLTSGHTLYPECSSLVTPAYPMAAPHSVSGCSPITPVWSMSLPIGSLHKSFTGSTGDAFLANSRFTSSASTFSPHVGAKFSGSLGTRDTGNSQSYPPYESNSLFSPPAAYKTFPSQDTKHSLGTETFPGDPDFFHSRLI